MKIFWAHLELDQEKLSCQEEGGEAKLGFPMSFPQARANGQKKESSNLPTFIVPISIALNVQLS